MKLTTITRQSGISMLGFVLSICIVALLSFLSLHSLHYAERQVEEVIMETDLSNMRWGVRELWAHRNATGQSFAPGDLESTNPMQLLNDYPKNYIGEYAKTPPDVFSVWYFDTNAKRLVYIFSDGRQLRYRLISSAKRGRASLGAIGGIDLALD